MGRFCLTVLSFFSSHKGDAALQEKVDPYSLVADEISLVSKRLRSSAAAKVFHCDFFFSLSDMWVWLEGNQGW